MTLAFGAALRAVAGVLERLGIPWFVGGSVASLVHGEIRTTQDVDVVVDLRSELVDELVAALTGDFLVDAEFVRLAVHSGTSCNLVHRESGMKVDLFLLRRRPFSQEEMRRRLPVPLQPGLVTNVATAEDCVLTKLEWFEKGGRVSERQWRDVQGIVRVQGRHLDQAYLRRWAVELGVDEVLERALRREGPPPPTAGSA